MRNRASERAGVGMVLAVVLLLVFILSVASLARGTWGTQVASSTARSLAGDAALDLAANALSEAHFRLSNFVNDPACDLYRRFREEPGAFAALLGPEALPALSELLGRVKGYDVQGAGVAAEVVFQAPSATVLPQPGDRFGALRLTATVRHAPTGVTRTLQRTFDFRTTLTAAPRYFDTYSVFLRDVGDLLRAASHDGSANRTIASTAGKLKALRREALGLAAKAKKAKCGAAAELERLGQGLPTVRVAAGAGDTSREATALHYFPAPPLSLYTYDADVDLAALDLPGQVASRLAALAPLHAAQRSARTSLQKSLGAGGSPDKAAAAATGYVTATTALAAQLRALLLEDYKAFQDRLIEVGARSAAQLEQYARQLSPDEFRRKASLVIGELDPATGKPLNASACLRALAGRDEGLSGLVFVDNPTTPLVLEGAYRGRLVVVARGDVAVQGAQAAELAEDLLTVVAFGKLTVLGQVRASLLAVGPFVIEPTARVEGNLVLARLDLTNVRPAQVFAGSVKRDERVVAGAEGAAPAPDHQYVTLGPDPVFVDAERR